MAAAKDMLIAHGIKTPMGKVINVNDEDKSAPCFPCVVKPKSNGSSVGTSVVHSEEEYLDALKLGFKYEDDVLVEQYIKGREVDVGVICGRALPPIEICPKSGFFDYKNKYQDGMTDEYCPADFSEDITARLKDIAVKVFNAMYLEVYARMDFIVDEQDEIWCLEANTLPGMTPASLMPKEAAADGIGYNELCELVITESMKRFK
jgi:D-alanine-D-alanine ligase